MVKKRMDGGEMSELRRAAILVWHYQRIGGREASLATEITEAEQAQRVERFRLELQKIVGTDEIRLRINGGCVEAEVEDLRFISFEFISPKQEQWTLVTLLGRCPACGVETMSPPLYNLVGLGRMLEKFEPGFAHSCRGQQHSVQK